MNHQLPCWERNQVTRLVKPDAEEIEDHIFNAIHSPTRLQLSRTAGGPRVAATAEELVQQFLDPNRNYVQAVVLGDSGTGKSHLIQWLRLHIPVDLNTVKLTIPKSGTSLRGIVGQLIKELPVAEQGDFSSRLRETGTQLTTQNAKIDLFLNALAWSIAHGAKVGDDVDDGLKQLLPAVFMDPNCRADVFRNPGGSVDQIVKHIFDPPDKRGPESARQFTERDLPLDGKLYNRAAKQTKEAIDFINGEVGILPRAVEMMNACLEGAISQSLNFSADNLIDLMNALRRHLNSQGKRLILLIEDFARLQGIDTALLQALITPPGQGHDRLCEIRWAMAVTTGYFLRLDATVRTRANIVVDMDISAPMSVEAMAAGYLNAVRVGEEKLLGESNSNSIPNACIACKTRDPCFAAFGDVKGVGLFPFTKKAISIFSERTGATVDDKFNPRQFLSAVIEPVLFKHFYEIERGEFPSALLLESLGGAKSLSPSNCSVISNKDGDDLGERRIALLELWDGSGSLVNLPEGIQTAFGISTLKDVATTGQGQTSGEGTAKPDPNQSKPEVQIPHVNELKVWGSEKRVLPQAVVNPLRELVYASLESYIDWDAFGFKKAEITSPRGAGAIPFRRLSINFHEQQAQAMPSLVTLTLPLDPKNRKERRETALALQALVLFERNRSWDFDEANIMLPILLEMLERWATYIKKQIQLLYASTKTWNPTVAAAELLALGIHQSGRNTIDASIESLALKVWDPKEPIPMMCMTPQFGHVNKKILQNWAKIQGLIRLFCSGTKGGQAGDFVNPLVVTRAVRSLRQRSLKLTQEPPEDSRVADLKLLADIYRDVKARFLLELETERSALARLEQKGG